MYEKICFKAAQSTTHPEAWSSQQPSLIEDTSLTPQNDSNAQLRSIQRAASGKSSTASSSTQATATAATAYALPLLPSSPTATAATATR